MKYNEKNKDKIEVINFVVFCEFIKEYISSVSYKHKFEGLIENLYEFYVEELEKNGVWFKLFLLVKEKLFLFILKIFG